ncbi:MAG: DUF5686 and carboxypeptidase regulatory-like domain-containing protein [Flavobacteriaceae bacterium]|nr:DUF5686 and carboxypeptidase regulatory-like domain-containing protein [Flavobacteriaceae bacterium]
MRKLIFYIICFVCLSTSVQAQFHISGVVKDSKTKEILPYATVITQKNLGLITDAKGHFNIDSGQPITKLKVTYIGYYTQEIILNRQKFITIYLKPKVENLQTVQLFSKENPALAIMRKVILNKDKNDINKALSTYKYTSYNKLLVTASPDSIDSKIDSIFKVKEGKKIFSRIDSSGYQFKKEIEKHHLYITEKISEHKHQKGKYKKEIVLASRMAGFKNPIYELLAFDIQSFDFYQNRFTVLGNSYKSPISNNALNFYKYKILDTLTNNTYLIYFKPKKNKETVGIEGVLYINNNGFVIVKAIAELKGVIAVKATQNFTFKPNFKIWFPTSTSISIRRGNNNKQINLFGNKIGFSVHDETPKDSIKKKTKSRNNPENQIYLASNTQNFDIEINTPIKVKNPTQTVEIDVNAANRKQAFWNKYRTDSLSKRGVQAYKYMDSIGKEEKFEHYLSLSRKIFKGYYPIKNFDFNLSQLINFNNQEGLRVGGGFTTNTDFSKTFKFKAYSAYGLKDNTIKYHLSAYARPNKNTNTWIGIGYTDDLSEAAKLNFLFEDTSFSLINPRNLNIGQFFNYKTTQVYLDFDVKSNLESRIQLSNGAYETKFRYQFISPSTFVSDYNLSLATMALQWTPFSKYMNTPIGKIRVKDGHLKIIAQLTKSFDNVLDGDFDFTQFNFKISQKIKALSKSTTHFLLQGGLIFGDAPISHLYNAFPNYALKNPWQKRINLSGVNAFETMTFNEFISDKYVSFQVRQSFNRLKISKRFKPQINVVSRFAIGTLDNPQFHRGFNFKKMEKGYFESGLEVNKFLLKGFGFSFFYRYGAYHNPKFEDNIAVKLNYHFGLNF